MRKRTDLPQRTCPCGQVFQVRAKAPKQKYCTWGCFKAHGQRAVQERGWAASAQSRDTRRRINARRKLEEAGITTIEGAYLYGFEKGLRSKKEVDKYRERAAEKKATAA